MFLWWTTSSDKLDQICVTLSRWFLHKTALSSAPAHCSFTLGSLNQSLKSHGFICDAIYSSLVCMRKNHFATKQLFAELEIRLCAWRHGEFLSSTVESVFEQNLVNDSSANTANIYWGSLWGQMCCSVIVGNFSSSISLVSRSHPQGERVWLHKPDFLG